MGGLKVDPAIERWAAMRESTVRHFRITTRTVRAGILWGVVVPLMIYEGAIAEMVRECRFQLYRVNSSLVIKLQYLYLCHCISRFILLRLI